MFVLLPACAKSTKTPEVHGALLSAQRIDGVAGATTYKIRYVSQAISGKRIEVTGIAAIPVTPAADGSRVVLTVGHGTTGLGDKCAPSRNPGATEIGAVAAAGVANGWIVAATDYEGLGTPGVHPYLVGVSEGRSVLDAALAAAQLPNAHASDRVLIAGYSQGGHAAAWANQIAPSFTPSLRVLGTFAGAPATEVDRILANGRAFPIQRFVMAIVAGYEAAYPNADPKLYLTQRGIDALPATRDGCLADIERAVGSIPPTELVRPDGPTNRVWLTLGEANNPGGVRGGGPVLIVHSDQDTTIPVELSALMHARMCAVGQTVERVVIHAGDHVQAIGASFAMANLWLQQRASGVPAHSDCATTPR